MSHDLAWICVEGGVVSEPKLRYTKNGATKVMFGVLSSPRWIARTIKGGCRLYFTVMAIGKMGETIYPMLKLGIPIRVEGNYNDSIYRDHLTDEPRCGRFIYATRIKTFTYWKRRSVKNKQEDIQQNIDDITVPDIDIDLDELPF